MQDFSKLTLVLDGYSAPLTAGNFAQRVLQGEFNNRPLQVEFASVLANPPMEAPEGAHCLRLAPLEMFCEHTECPHFCAVDLQLLQERGWPMLRSVELLIQDPVVFGPSGLAQASSQGSLCTLPNWWRAWTMQSIPSASLLCSLSLDCLP